MPRTVTVQPGETLFSIADREYGNGNRYRELFKANEATFVDARLNADDMRPTLIYPGETIIIPDDVPPPPAA